MHNTDLGLVHRLRGREPRVVVVGDLILDRYFWGSTDRVSPEAPVPVVDVKSRSCRLGGAANVAANLASLGAKVRVCSVIGSEGATTELTQLLSEIADVRGLVVEVGRPITEKSRVIAGHQQVLRYDSETRAPVHADSAKALLAQVASAIDDADAVIVSDYGKGVCTLDVVRATIELARAKKVPVFCDPKGTDYSKYRGATAVTPNRREASEAIGVPIRDDESLERAGQRLRAQLESPYCLITLSEDGMALFDATGVSRLPTAALEVFDVTGAGDTVIAAIAFAVGGGATMLEACRFANLAAGVVVAKIGSASTTIEEVMLRLVSTAGPPGATGKVHARDELVEELQAMRLLGKKIVFTNGCFDILHRGHVTYLEAAAALGDLLVVGLNSDASVKRLKGPSRPVHEEDDRAYVLAGLSSVDYVTLFEEDTPALLIEAIAPDVLVKGGDYRPETIVGADFVVARGGHVTTIPLVEGRSTSKAIERMQLASEKQP